MNFPRLTTGLMALSLLTAPALAQTQTGTGTEQSEDALMAFIKDTRPLSELSDDELKQRFKQARLYLKAGGLSADVEKSLKRAVRQARLEIEARGGKSKTDTVETPAQEPDSQQTAKPAQVTMPIGTQVPDDVLAFINDTRPLSGLSNEELTARLKAVRKYAKNDALPADTRDKLAAILKATRKEAMARGVMGKKQTTETDAKTETPPAQDKTASTAGQEQVPPAKASPGAEAKAQAILNDPVKAETLSDKELRQRLAGIRDLLAGNQVSGETERALRKKLQAERVVLRGRVAKDETKTGDDGQQKDKGDTTVNIQIVLADRRPPDQLSDAELRRRIDVYRDAAIDARYGEADKIRWKKAMNDDRRALRDRLIVERQKRAKGLKNGGIDIQLGLNFDPGRPPRRDVFAAEVDDQQLEDVLVAPPRVKIQRRYTIEEVEASPELRDAMPRIEIDTIHFGFGEAFVREEEVENLDRIAEIMEKILATHPREIFVIEGHTDAVGSDDANQSLSRQRAAAVKQALATYYVIPPENLETVGYGERYLKIPTPEPEVENRRVSVARGTPLVGELEQ